METKTYPETTEPVADRPVVKPAVDIYESADELLLVVDLPGVQPGDVSVDIDKDILTIQAKREGRPNGGARVLAGDTQPFDYKRVFTVPNTIDPDKIKADLVAGVLEVHLPRHEKTKPRRIQIGGATS
ncbi:MAG: Hsp20/alpha crystallin family protein [Deltaproteobacteria bacterium]|nr:Hsp20/alpha crystallin family protein [Deltaproteobacteria bacterium]